MGLVVATPSFTVTSASGLEPTTVNAVPPKPSSPVPSGTVSRNMYGLGLVVRRIR